MKTIVVRERADVKWLAARPVCVRKPSSPACSTAWNLTVSTIVRIIDAQPRQILEVIEALVGDLLLGQ